MVYGGEGIARMPADEQGRRKAVFVPFVLPGERVEVALTEQKPALARGRLSRIVAASLARTEPGCPYFGECGGCQYQHAGYDEQLEIKRGILRESFERIAKLPLPEPLTTHPSPPWKYRNRARLQVQARPDFALGYFRWGSHTLLPVRECPISSPLLNRAIAALWEMGESRRVPAEVREVELFADGQDGRLLVELQLGENSASERDWQRLAEFAAGLRQALPETAGVAVFAGAAKFKENRSALVQLDIPELLCESFGAGSVDYNTELGSYRVSAGSFFQTNRFLVETLARLATENRAGDFALDLYAGTGLFSLPLSQTFREVAAVEAAPFAFHDLKQNSPSNVSGYRFAADKFLAHLPAEARFDYIVVDPPRSGLGEKLAMVLAGLKASAITYVSCDPSTLARDVRVLAQAGYRIEQAHLVDLFPQTFHIETVLALVR